MKSYISLDELRWLGAEECNLYERRKEVPNVDLGADYLLVIEDEDAYAKRGKVEITFRGHTLVNRTMRGPRPASLFDDYEDEYKHLTLHDLDVALICYNEI